MITAQDEATTVASRKYRTYVLSALGVAALFNFFDRSIFSVLAVSIKSDLSLSDTQIGLLGGFGFALFYAIVGIPLARIADRHNRITLVSVCLAVWSLATAACGMASGFISLLLARIGVGAGEAGCFPPSYSVLSDYYPPERRSFAIGVFHFWGNIGFLLGLVGAGIVSDLFGWRAAFIIFGLPGVLFAVILKLTVREPVRGALDKARTPVELGFKEAVKVLTARRAYIHLFVAYSLSAFAFYAILLWLPQFFARSFSMTQSELGMYYGLAFGGGMIVGVGLGAVIAPRFIAKDRRWEMLFPAAAALSSLPLALAALIVPSQTTALVLTFLFCTCASAGLGPGFAAIQSLSEPNFRATASALVLFAAAIIGQGLGPTLVGVLSDVLSAALGEHSLPLAIALAATAFGWSSFHYWLGSRRFLRDMA